MDKHIKKQNNVSFSEEDAASILEKYKANTVLMLLQEVANYQHWKIDWNVLVKKTKTGISNAKEYQMLWRHLVYGHDLIEDFEDNAQPLDDDSDLECEREALLSEDQETALEAAACVQVMIESLGMSESPLNTSFMTAPLTINVPACDSSRIPSGSSELSSSMPRSNIVFPVSVQRHARSNVSSTRAIKTNGLVFDDTSINKKRKTWTEEEDVQLQDAVQRWGEGNWATMAESDDFPLDKSPSQLYKRWRTIRKKGGSSN